MLQRIWISRLASRYATCHRMKDTLLIASLPSSWGGEGGFLAYCNKRWYVLKQDTRIMNNASACVGYEGWFGLWSLRLPMRCSSRTPYTLHCVSQLLAWTIELVFVLRDLNADEMRAVAYIICMLSLSRLKLLISYCTFVLIYYVLVKELVITLQYTFHVHLL